MGMCPLPTPTHKKNGKAILKLDSKISFEREAILLRQKPSLAEVWVFVIQNLILNEDTCLLFFLLHCLQGVLTDQLLHSGVRRKKGK